MLSLCDNFRLIRYFPFTFDHTFTTQIAHVINSESVIHVVIDVALQTMRNQYLQYLPTSLMGSALHSEMCVDLLIPWLYRSASK